MNRTKAHIRRAVEIAGSQAKLAEGIGMSQQGVSFLLTRAKNVSVEVAVAIDRYTKGKISKAALRPDIFGDAA
jgi:DNA-binding transcriptional regulator YdaS (Cro superfamily)